ncbi:uncharacterized protein LOC126370833 [Pectinophora gossypiella]|uniref:uncharacterized protein LOC126370833 n=1 Tax=Pectinophora gossypiella TaxID=13191 RepID=UPI00214E7C4D|nr:uncharacterized protein LOC126370833 [Pectinophora gossypiella]
MSETDSTATEDSNKLSGKKQIKFELCGSGPGYVGGGIRRSLHGIIYQLNLLMLFMKRGLEQGYNFHLATEVDAAGKFDDVVFQYKDNEGNTKHRFLQAKHKQNYKRKLNKSDLLNQTRDDYSVQKYFMSYFNIKTNKPKLFQGEYQDFIICTNIDIDDDIIDEFDAIQYPDPLLEFDKEKCASPPKRLKFKKGTNLYEELEEILLKNANYYLIAEKLGTMMAKIRNDRNKVITIEKIFTDHKDWIMEHIFDTSTEKMNGNKHCFKLRDDFLNPIDQDKVNLNEIFLNAYAKEENEESKLDNIKTVLALTQYQLARSFLKSKPKTKVVSHQQQEIDTFLNKLVLAVNQPTEDEIKDITQEEIGNYMKLIDSELVANKLQVCILDWAKRRHGYFITSEDCKDFFRDVENQLMCFWQTGLTLLRKSKIEKLECLFDENETIQAINNFLVGTENNQLLLLYYDNPLLTEAKLMQLKQNARSDEFIFCDMEVLLKQVDDTVCPLKAFQSRASDQLFIMFSNNSDVNSEVKLLIHRLFKVLVSREEKQIILIMPFIIKDQFESLTKYLIGDIRYAKVFDVNNNFGDLCIESQEKLLKEAILTFKGCKVKLGELDADDLKRSISGDILSQLVCRELQIKDLNKDDQYGEVAEYYITRSLCRTISISPEVISQNQFQIKYDDDVKSVEPNQDVILVSDNSDSKIVFESLCQSNKNDIHWLKHKNGQLIWQESRGSLSKLQKYVVTGGNKTEDETSELFEQYHPT